MKPPGTVLLPGRPDRITNPSGVYEMRTELHVDTSSLEREGAVRRAELAYARCRGSSTNIITINAALS